MFTTHKDRLEWSQRLLQLQPGNLDCFNIYALLLYDWQKRSNPAYQRYLRQKKLFHQGIASWREIPAVPQTLFKSCRLASHTPQQTHFTFLSSGTTGSHRSHHYLTSLDIYQAVSCAGAPIFTSSLNYPSTLPDPIHLHFLTPSPKEAADSSLSRMFSFWMKKFGTDKSRFWVKDGKILLPALRTALESAIERQEPLGVLGPAFSFVHLLDHWKKNPLLLPSGSFLLETGGFKGRTREIRKPPFYLQLSSLMGVPDHNIWNEYSMCELSSQAYAQGTHGKHHTPPWARVLVIDPTTNHEVKIGQCGLIRWIDLANVDSVLAIQTQDMARRTRDGFILLGRLPQLPLRGCSLNAEDFIPTI